MRLNEQQIRCVRNALVDFEQSAGTERAERSAIRLSAIVETVFELAEGEGIVPEADWDPLEEVEEMAADEVLETDKPNLHQQILALDAQGKKATEIASELGVSKPTVYNHLKFKREQEAK